MSAGAPSNIMERERVDGTGVSGNVHQNHVARRLSTGSAQVTDRNDQTR